MGRTPVVVAHSPGGGSPAREAGLGTASEAEAASKTHRMTQPFFLDSLSTVYDTGISNGGGVGGMTDEEVAWRLAPWQSLEDDLPPCGVHPRWQEVLDRRQEARVAEAASVELAEGRRMIQQQIGGVVALGGREVRVEATCRAGVVVRGAAGYRECVPWVEAMQKLCGLMELFS